VIKLRTILVTIIAVGLLACSSSVPEHEGRIFTMKILEMTTTDELRYFTSDTDASGYIQTSKWLIQPDKAGNELVLIRIAATNRHNVVVVFDERTAVLHDHFENEYRPISVSESRVYIPPSDPVPGKYDAGSPALLEGELILPNGMGFEGWMVFEVPEGTKLKSFSWRAGDSITVRF